MIVRTAGSIDSLNKDTTVATSSLQILEIYHVKQPNTGEET